LPWIARLRVSRRCRTNQTLLQEPHRGRMIAERARLLQFCLACIARLRASRGCRTNQILLQEPALRANSSPRGLGSYYSVCPASPGCAQVAVVVPIRSCCRSPPLRANDRREDSAPTILFGLHRSVARKSPLSYQSDLAAGARTAGEFFAERARLLLFYLPCAARLHVSRRCRTNQVLL